MTAHDLTMGVVLRTAWWGVLSSAAAPVLLIGGWTLAAALQPAGFDSVTESISALAARGAQDRWVMTTALAGLGVCHGVTAASLRPAAAAGRVLLGLGGAATVLVALLPLPADQGGSRAHTVAAALALTSLAAWPALAWRRRPPVVWVLRPVVGAGAAVLLLGSLGWLFAELLADGERIGLAERVAAGSQALWPLAVVAATRRDRSLRVPS